MASAKAATASRTKMDSGEEQAGTSKDGRRDRERERSGGGGSSGGAAGGTPSASSARGAAGASGGGGGAAGASLAGPSSASKDDKDRKIGHRRVDEAGQVSYKKVHVNQLMHSIQLGIQHSLGALAKHDERDLLMQDFMTVETVVFPKGGSTGTPAHPYSDFTFRTVAPLAFRYFLNLFGIQREDFMVSLCSEAMRELSNPGASGSIFYLSSDDEFILKTVMHKEAEFLQKLLPGYYMNLNQNPHTLLPKFFGMYCYQCNQKNIRLTVMNNLLPSNVKMHLKFDLKGSTYKRKASKHERAKKSPTFKDLDFMELLPDGLLLESETYNALISTLRRDCRVLESFRIMDYSLLVGIHNLDQSAKEDAENGGEGPSEVKTRHVKAPQSLQQQTSAQGGAGKKLMNSTAMESIQAQTEPIDEQEHLPPGGIPARNHKGERLLLFLGIIDILQSYRMRKKLEHTFKAIIHDGDTVSVHRPGFYAHRFLDFMADKVFKKIPSLDLPEFKGSHRKFRTIVSSLIALKHSPSRKSKRDSSVKKVSTASASDDQREEVASSHLQGAAGVDGKDSASSRKAAAAAVAGVPPAPNSSPKIIKPNTPPVAGASGAATPDSAKITTKVAVESAPDVTAGAPAAAAAPAAGETPAAMSPSEAEMNLPAVLWDKPPGARTRSVAGSGAAGATGARSPTGEACSAVIAAAFSNSSPHHHQHLAGSSSSSVASSTRTVVQRGAESSYQQESSTVTSSSSSRVQTSSSSTTQQQQQHSVSRYSSYVSSSQPDVVPAEKSRPRNRLHDNVLKHSSGDVRSDSRLSDGGVASSSSGGVTGGDGGAAGGTPSHQAGGGGGAHGTPSRLSVGAGSLGWNTPTPTWTEGTPSFTESTYSGVDGAQGNTPSRSPGRDRDGIATTRNYKDTPYHETEI